MDSVVRRHAGERALSRLACAIRTAARAWDCGRTRSPARPASGMQATVDGFTAAVYHFPARGISIAWMSNASALPAKDILDEVLADHFRARPPAARHDRAHAGRMTDAPDGLACLEVAMRLRRVGELVALVDLDLQPLLLHGSESFARHGIEVGAARPCSRTSVGRVTIQRAALDQLGGGERRHRARRTAETHHQAALAQRIQRFDEGVLADAVVHHVRALPLGELLHGRRDVIAPAHQHVPAAVLLRQLPPCLRCRRRR